MRRIVVLTLLSAFVLSVCTSVQSGERPNTPTPMTKITRGQAIELALQATGGPGPEITAVENPRNPVARLMTFGEYGRLARASFATDPATLVWVVQVEGESWTAGIAPPEARQQFNYAVVVLDANTGRFIVHSRLFAPIFSP